MAPIVTRVARAAAGENYFCGYAVNGELVGRDGYWSALSLAVGHRRLDADEAGAIDDINTSHLVGDPRIWPLKLARLVASYGGTIAGYSAGLLITEQSRLGPSSTLWAGRFFVRVRDELAGQPLTAERFAELEARGLVPRPIPGFGVPFRDEDERLIGLHERMRQRGRDRLPFATLYRQLIDVLGAAKGMRPNVAAAAAAILLDLGFTPEQGAHIGAGLACAYFLANANEGARQRLPQLQRLPEPAVRYVGAAPRQSLRAAARAIQRGGL
jgi:hypothetical protein